VRRVSCLGGGLEPQDQLEPAAPTQGAGGCDIAAVTLGYGPDECQAEARATLSVLRTAGEPLEDMG
jgi:hypothetical protein